MVHSLHDQDAANGLDAVRGEILEANRRGLQAVEGNSPSTAHAALTVACIVHEQEGGD